MTKVLALFIITTMTTMLHGKKEIEVQNNRDMELETVCQEGRSPTGPSNSVDPVK
jgi:hypothetical protein